MKSRYFILSFLLLMSVVICVDIPVQAQSAPIQITNCQELQNIKNKLEGNYQLAKDIDCNGFTFVPIGTPTDPFSGTLSGLASDGQTVYKIENLTILQPKHSAALFGSIGGDSSQQLANIHDLILTNINIQGQDGVASLAIETIGNSLISNVSISGVIGTPTGSIAPAQSISGAIYSVGDQTATNDVVENVSVNLRTQGDAVVISGFADINQGIIRQCSTQISINTQNQAAGFILLNNGTISDSYATGSIDSVLAGFGFGMVNSGTINNSYAAVKMTTGTGPNGLQSSGFLGTQPGGTTTDSFWDTQVSGLTTSAAGTGEITDNMFQRTTYSGWNFTNTWSQYPHLRKIQHASTSNITIQISTYGNGSGTVLCNGNDCPSSVPLGTSIIFTAKPNSGSVFESWANTCVAAGGSANGGSCTVDDITSNISLLAIWGIAPPTYTITTSTSGPGSGTILCNGSKCPASVTSGTTITFTALADKGSLFAGFGGECGGGAGPTYTCTIPNIDFSLTVSAYFILLPPPAPADLKATSVSTGINLSWNDTIALTYKVYRAEKGVNGNKYTLIKNIEYPNSTYTDSTMPDTGRYLYYVTGVYYPNVESPKSNIVSVSWTA